MTFGIIGTNFISSNFVAALSFTEAKAVSVYSRKQETGRAFAEKHAISSVYTDLDAFLSSDIDAVYIASPNFLHKEQSIRALRAGKHVLVEKPAAPSLAEWEEMKKEAKAAGRVLMEAMRPIHAEAWQMVKSSLPKIGRVREAVFDYCQYSSRYDAFLSGKVLNAFNPALSNAALLDIGIYPLSAAVFTFGAPKSIKSRSCFLPGGFECAGTLLLAYDGFTVTVTYSKVANSITPSHIIGEEGGLVIDKISNPRSITLYTERGAKSEPLALPKTEAPDNMFEEVGDFCRAIQTGELLPAAACTDITLAVMDTVRRQNGIVFPSDGEA